MGDGEVTYREISLVRFTRTGKMMTPISYAWIMEYLEQRLKELYMLRNTVEKEKQNSERCLSNPMEGQEKEKRHEKQRGKKKKKQRKSLSPNISILIFNWSKYTN